MSRDPGEMWSVLVRRVGVLRATSSGTARKAELASSLDVSDSTAERALRELRRVGFVTDAPDGYRRTVVGSLALTAYDRATRRTEGVTRSRDVLSMLPTDAPLSPAMLDGVDVVTSTPEDPDRARARLVDLFDGAARVWALSPVAAPRTVVDIGESIAEDELSAQILLTDAFVERVISTYHDTLQAALTTDHFELRQTGDLPFGLAISKVDDDFEVAVAVPSADGVEALLVNDADGAVAWARTYFDEQWTAAECLTESVLS